MNFNVKVIEVKHSENISLSEFQIIIGSKKKDIN